jgi:hypothetical protein
LRPDATSRSFLPPFGSSLQHTDNLDENGTAIRM